MSWFAFKGSPTATNASVFLIAAYFFTIGGYLFYEGYQADTGDEVENMIVGAAQFLIGIWVLYLTPAFDEVEKK